MQHDDTHQQLFDEIDEIFQRSSQRNGRRVAIGAVGFCVGTIGIIVALMVNVLAAFFVFVAVVAFIYRYTDELSSSVRAVVGDIVETFSGPFQRQ